ARTPNAKRSQSRPISSRRCAVLVSPSGTFTVGFMGSLKPWHGLAALVEAFGRFYRGAPNTRLLIVGDGPERARLENDLYERGLRAATHFTGSVHPGEVLGWLACMDVGVA